MENMKTEKESFHSELEGLRSEIARVEHENFLMDKVIKRIKQREGDSEGD